MRRAIATLALIGVTAASTVATIWWVQARTDPPEEPPDPQPCLTAGKAKGLDETTLRLVQLTEHEKLTGLEKIQLRERLRHADIAACEPIYERLTRQTR